LVGDMYEILPLLIKELREVKTLVAESRWPNA